MVVVALLGAGLGTAAGAHYTIRTKNFVDPTGPRFAGCCATEPERSELRVVTFNIQYSVEIDKAIRLFKSAPELRDADFVLLQEMDEDGVRRIADALSLATTSTIRRRSAGTTAATGGTRSCRAGRWRKIAS